MRRSLVGISQCTFDVEDKRSRGLDISLHIAMYHHNDKELNYLSYLGNFEYKSRLHFLHKNLGDNIAHKHSLRLHKQKN